MANIEHSRRMRIRHEMREYGLRLDDLDTRNNRPGDKPEKLELQMLMRLGGVTFESMQEFATVVSFDPIDLKDEIEAGLSLFDDDEPDKLEQLKAASNDGIVTYDGLPFEEWPEDVIRQILDAKQASPKSGLPLTDKNAAAAAAAAEDKQQTTDDDYPFRLQPGQILRLDDDDGDDYEQPMDGGRIRKAAAADKQQTDDGRPNKRLRRSSSARP